MERLWAPWRLSYVTQPAPPSADDCFLCRFPTETNDRENLVARRTKLSSVILNKFPYNNGHLLVAPLAHKSRLDQLTVEELLDLQFTLRDMTEILEKRMKPEGFNIGINLGRAAGAGVPGHLHWHIVPRWTGDTNFMPIFTDAKVMVQSLDALWEMLQEK